MIDRVQVVDDGSTDATASIARAAGANVTVLPTRIPVGEAIMHHLDGDPDDILVWCDADLTGLTSVHIDSLIARFIRGDVAQVMSCRALPPTWPSVIDQPMTRWAWKTLFGPISGERVMRRHDFSRAMSVAKALDWSEMVRGYGIVLFLNWYLAKVSTGHTIVYLPGLRQRQKYQKWGARAGGAMLTQWLEFIRVWIKIRLNTGKIKAVLVNHG